MRHAARVRGWMAALALALTAGAGLATEEGTAAGPWLGVRLGGPAAPERGVPLSGIFVGSPADRAGLRARDVIVALGGEPVTDAGDLVAKVRAREAGAWLELEVVRQGHAIDVDLRLAERPEKVSEARIRRGWVGLEAIELPQSLREYFGAPADAGVMISAVAEGSPAESAGFRLGDVVYELDGFAVGSLRALHALVEGGGIGNEYEFSVARDGALLVLESRIEEAPAKAP